MGEIMTFEPTEAQFGVFWKYLQRPNVTDVDYNGSELWITDLKIGRYRVKEHLSDAFISTFTHNISNCVNRQFNNANKVLEADTRELRISIIHEAAAASGTSICIRKSPSMVRMNIERMLEESYCPERILPVSYTHLDVYKRQLSEAASALFSIADAGEFGSRGFILSVKRCH